MHQPLCSKRIDICPSMTFSCVGDVITSSKRAHYLSQLESVNNVAQAVGPLIGGFLSSFSLSYALYELMW